MGSHPALGEQKNDYQLKAEYYDEEGVLINRLLLSKIKEMGERRIPTLLEMEPVDEPGHKTVMIYHNINFNMPIEEVFFSKQQMKRIR